MTADADNELKQFLEQIGVKIRCGGQVLEFERSRDTDDYPIEPKKKNEKNDDISASDFNGYTMITEPSCIIGSPLDSHIILNSGPGTGKTYTIIRRLIYILENLIHLVELVK